MAGQKAQLSVGGTDSREDHSKYLMKFISEDQVTAVGTITQMPVFVQLMIPGNTEAIDMYFGMQRAAEKYKDQAKFTVVNCSKHLAFCQGVGMRGKIHVDVYFPPMTNPSGKQVVPIEPYYGNPTDISFETYMRKFGILPNNKNIDKGSRFVAAAV